jgi:hypothetical protein
MAGRRDRRPKQLMDKLQEKRRYWKLKRGSTGWYPVQNSLLKRLRTCSKTHCSMNNLSVIVEDRHTST